MRAKTSRDNYLEERFGLGDDPELVRVRKMLVDKNVDFMSISSHEARMLQFLIRGFGVRKIVEFGTLFGYSALCMAQALPADGTLVTLEVQRENWEIAQEMFRGSTQKSKITALLGNAVDLMRQLDDQGPFDMVFIDANKGGYLTYLDWAERHVRKGGLIVGDNTFLWGGVYDEPSSPDSGPEQIRVMKEFNRRLSDPQKYNSTLIPTGEGMTVGQLRL